MGRRGPLPKPADRIHGHRRRTTRPVDGTAPATPAAAEGWVPSVREAWDVYWRSDLSRLALDVDLPGVRRLFDLYDQHARAMEVVRMALVVKGSTGQLRTNPLADHVLKLEGVILRLENELGLTPLARSRLGITVSRPARVPDEPAADFDPYAHLRVMS